jgi:hypothetical protein
LLLHNGKHFATKPYYEWTGKEFARTWPAGRISPDERPLAARVTV